MSCSFEDDELEQVTNFTFKKKEKINPDIKIDSKIVPKFLSNTERKNIYTEEVKKLEIKEKEREKICKEHNKLYLTSKPGKYTNSYSSGNFF